MRPWPCCVAGQRSAHGSCMAPIGFAATAPLGADVLERLAARHDIAFSLTRPDRPAGRGRRLDPPPAKVAAERLGIPVLQPERLDETVELQRHDRDVRVRRDRPAGLLARHLWLNVHPSLLPRWRGAAPVERAIMAGDDGDRRDDHQARGGARRRPDRGAAGVPDRRGRRRGAVYGDRPRSPPACWPRARESRFRHQPDEGTTYAEKLTAADRELDLAA